jgi:hypothetical protein
LPLKLPIKAKGEERDQVKGSCSLEQSNRISNSFKQKKANPSHIDSYTDTAAARGEDQAGPILILTSLGWVRRFNGQAHCWEGGTYSKFSHKQSINNWEKTSVISHERFYLLSSAQLMLWNSPTKADVGLQFHHQILHSSNSPNP